MRALLILVVAGQCVCASFSSPVGKIRHFFLFFSFIVLLHLGDLFVVRHDAFLVIFRL